MKNLLYIILVLLLFTHAANAQQQGAARRFEKVHAIKVAYITDKMHLSSEEAARFWPVYNKFDEEKRALRRNFFKRYENKGKITSEAQAMHYVDEDLDYQQSELTLRRNYKAKLLKVLSPQQLAELYKAEREFKIMLLQQMNNKPD